MNPQYDAARKLGELAEMAKKHEITNGKMSYGLMGELRKEILGLCTQVHEGSEIKEIAPSLSASIMAEIAKGYSVDGNEYEVTQELKGLISKADKVATTYEEIEAEDLWIRKDAAMSNTLGNPSWLKL